MHNIFSSETKNYYFCFNKLHLLPLAKVTRISESTERYFNIVTDCMVFQTPSKMSKPVMLRNPHMHTPVILRLLFVEIETILIN